MRFFGASKRKKSIATLSKAFSSSASLYAPSPHRAQKGSLALPTKLDEVAESVHGCIPQQLPGEQASQDDVRYFLYQILTVKDYNLARRNPQWVLETCMLWQGDGNRLRSLHSDAFQQLCPLRPGYAVIDWAVKGSKFRPQDMPPCGVRDEIAYRVKNIVDNLKRKEEGHRGPGWQKASQLKSVTTGPVAMGREQHRTFQGFPGAQMSTFGPKASFPVQPQYYGLGNHSMPLLSQASSFTAPQSLPYMHRQPSLPASQYLPQAAATMQRMSSSPMETLSVPSHDTCEVDSPNSYSRSPMPSFFRSRSLSSRHTNSTAQTSPFESECEDQFWLPNADGSRSVRAPTSGTHCRSPELFYSNLRQGTTTKPTRYKGSRPAQPTRLHSRSYHPGHQLAYLRSSSYDSSSAYASSETSLTPSDSATNKYEFRRDSIIPHRRNSYSPSIASNLSLPSSPQTYVTSLPCTQSVSSSRLGTAMPVARDGGRLARSINNYKIDAHALDTAETIGWKSMPGPVRTIMAEEQMRRKPTGDRSDSELSTYKDNPSSNSETPVRPLLRFQNPRTGQPRLTIYETIEQQETLGKQHCEDQRRIDLQQGRLKTVFETIEEQEWLDGKPQRGMDTYAGRDWSDYL